MRNIISVLCLKAKDAIRCAFAAAIADPRLLEAEVTPGTQPQFGHYQCNSALKIGKALGIAPRLAAEKIVAHFDRGAPEGGEMVSRLEIAGPGFINITLSTPFLAAQIEALLHDERLGVPLPDKKEKIIVEFSSPNIAKELHVGHLRSTIIGDAIARLFEFLGHEVLRLNHIGDWGTQFGMLIAYMQENVPDVLRGDVQTDLIGLMHWYRESKKRFDEDGEFKKRAQAQVIRLQGGDPQTTAAWKAICEISRKAFHEIYQLLDVQLIERGESFYNPYLAEVVADLDKKGLITLSDGARCIFLEGFVGRDGTALPLMVQKSDGGYNYDTTDMAAMRHRIQVEKADRIIILTDAGQALHFAMIEAASMKAGYLDPTRVRFDHVPFGVVLGQDGKKFKTRSGETEKLIDLLFEAVSHAKRIMQERLPDLSGEQLNTSAQILGIDAVKYADLSSHRIKDYLFSYDRMLRLEGNTAAFLLYAYVRIQGIKRKVGKEVSSVLQRAHVALNHPSEVGLALHLRQFGEVLGTVSKDLLPNRLCEYLYELAEKFNAFFRDCRVEGSPEEESRLLLCEATSRILEKGLQLLGLKTLDRM
jgi:arginyl-tRNA synthetase